MEFVYVVRRRDFFSGDWPQGFTPASAAAAHDVLGAFAQRGFFVERREAERCADWKQLIPYCVLTRGEEVYAVRRLAAGSEGRLHGRWSIGLGGHVGPEDLGAGDSAETFLGRALRRELDEELAMPVASPAAFLGVVNDDRTEVGQVHVGLVHRVEVRATVVVREISKMEGGFRNLVELAHLWQDPTRFESWSRIVLAELFFGRESVHQSRSTSQRDDRREDSRDG